MCLGIFILCVKINCSFSIWRCSFVYLFIYLFASFSVTSFHLCASYTFIFARIPNIRLSFSGVFILLFKYAVDCALKRATERKSRRRFSVLTFNGFVQALNSSCYLIGWLPLYLVCVFIPRFCDETIRIQCRNQQNVSHIEFHAQRHSFFQHALLVYVVCAQ